MLACVILVYVDERVRPKTCNKLTRRYIGAVRNCLQQMSSFSTPGESHKLYAGILSPTFKTAMYTWVSEAKHIEMNGPHLPEP